MISSSHFFSYISKLLVIQNSINELSKRMNEKSVSKDVVPFKLYKHFHLSIFRATCLYEHHLRLCFGLQLTNLKRYFDLSSELKLGFYVRHLYAKNKLYS